MKCKDCDRSTWRYCSEYFNNPTIEGCERELPESHPMAQAKSIFLLTRNYAKDLGLPYHCYLNHILGALYGEYNEYEAAYASRNEPKRKSLKALQGEYHNATIMTTNEFYARAIQDMSFQESGEFYYHNGEYETEIAVFEHLNYRDNFPYVCWYKEGDQHAPIQL